MFATLCIVIVSIAYHFVFSTGDLKYATARQRVHLSIHTFALRLRNPQHHLKISNLELQDSPLACDGSEIRGGAACEQRDNRRARAVFLSDTPLQNHCTTNMV